MALEVIFVVRLPRLAAHIAETLAAHTGHEITPLGSLNSLIAPRTELGILGNPLGIGFLLEHNLSPFVLLITGAGRVVVTLAVEAERFPADALHGRHGVVLTFYAVVAVGPRAALV